MYEKFSLKSETISFFKKLLLALSAFIFILLGNHCCSSYPSLEKRGPEACINSVSKSRFRWTPSWSAISKIDFLSWRTVINDLQTWSMCHFGTRLSIGRYNIWLHKNLEALRWLDGLWLNCNELALENAETPYLFNSCSTSIGLSCTITKIFWINNSQKASNGMVWCMLQKAVC